ncbi:hypothetical protein L3X38_025399 [Prunus dulcis]|uniref:Uncharacterized protein n=1 Tax=Prunus dulcis TaxID=3755 RepID=A0AAD4W454_PRUDU|nr:hypothetical protein L3X38_025399 [Prunus dulcis]
MENPFGAQTDSESRSAKSYALVTTQGSQNCTELLHHPCPRAPARAVRFGCLKRFRVAEKISEPRLQTPILGSAVAGYCPLWAWLHSHQPARFCFWELTKQLPRVVTHPGIAPASNSLNFGVPTNPKPVSSQKASHKMDARCAI